MEHYLLQKLSIDSSPDFGWRKFRRACLALISDSMQTDLKMNSRYSSLLLLEVQMFWTFIGFSSGVLISLTGISAAQLRFEYKIRSCTGNQEHIELHPVALHNTGAKGAKTKN